MMPSIDLSLMTQVFSERYSISLAAFEEQPEKVDSLTGEGQSVDIEALAERFKQFDALRTKDGVRLPLHKPDSAELTGEFVRYKEELRRTIVEYYWSIVDREDFQSVRGAGKSTIGWRLRFWTDAYDAPTIPSYMPSGGEQNSQSVLELVPEKLTADHWDDATSEQFFTHLFDFVKSEKQRDRTESIEKYHSFDQDAYQPGKEEYMMLSQYTRTLDRTRDSGMLRFPLTTKTILS